MLGGLCVEVVHLQAANRSRIDASMGADSGEKGKRRILDGGEGGIRLERLCQVCCSLRLQRILSEAANESRFDASEGASGGTHVKAHALELTKRRCIRE